MFKQLHDDYKLSFEAIGKKIGKQRDYVEARYHMFTKLSPTIKKILEEIQDGRTVYLLSCASDSDDPDERNLCDRGLFDIEEKETLKVIDGEGGY